MARDVYKIQTETSRGISRGIKVYHLKRSRVIEGNITVREWADALRYGVIKTQTPEADTVEQIISLGTLVGVADVVRDIGGTKDGILVKDLERTIIELLEMLPAPSLTLGEARYATLEEQHAPTAEELSPPDIFLSAVLEKEQEELNPVSLPSPIISLGYVTEQPYEEPTPEQLDAPEMVLSAVEEKYEEPVVVVTLLPPVFEMYRIVEQDAEQVQKAEPLLFPRFFLYSIQEPEKPEGKEPEKLTSPGFELFCFKEEEEPTLQPSLLPSPKITLSAILEEPWKEPADPSPIDSPIIELDWVEEAVREEAHETALLSAPRVILAWVNQQYAEEEQGSNTLQSPSFEKGSVTFVQEEASIDYYLSAPEIDYITVVITDKPTADERLPVPQVTLMKIASQEDIAPEPTTLKSPVVSLNNIITSDDDSNREVQLQAPNMAIWAIITRDDTSPPNLKLSPPRISIVWSYVQYNEETTVRRQLDAPEFIIETIDDSTDTAVLGKAVLGLAVLGKT